jgi:hypothetical protein
MNRTTRAALLLLALTCLPASASAELLHVQISVLGMD